MAALQQGGQDLYIPTPRTAHSRVLHLNHMAVELLNFSTGDTGNPYLFPGKRQGQPLQNPTKGFSGCWREPV